MIFIPVALTMAGGDCHVEGTPVPAVVVRAESRLLRVQRGREFETNDFNEKSWYEK
jgi:hypothetical protein